MRAFSLLSQGKWDPFALLVFLLSYLASVGWRLKKVGATRARVGPPRIANPRLCPHEQYKGVRREKCNTVRNKCAENPHNAPQIQPASTRLASSTDRTIPAKAPRFFMAAMHVFLKQPTNTARMVYWIVVTLLHVAGWAKYLQVPWPTCPAL